MRKQSDQLAKRERMWSYRDMKNFLTAQEVGILKEAHHSAWQRRNADRIKTILSLHKGLSYTEIAELLLLDETTIRRYEREYKKSGIDGLLENRYHGSQGLLTSQEEEALTTQLKRHTYQTVQEIVVFVARSYEKTYSVAGMTHLLHRLGFVYKKTQQIPGKVDIQRQEQFKKEYQELKQQKNPEDKIYFLDATHPQHNNMPFYGWIYKGETKTIKTNSGRTRLNLNGALNIEDMQITVLNETTINRHAMMRLLLTLEEQQPKGAILLIVDNARYNHSYELQLFLADHPRVQLKYLPPYSPNLNIIERLWKFMHKKHRDKYFERFTDFEAEVLIFFKHINQYNRELRSLLTDSFQTLPT